MTQDDILRMALEAGLISRHGCRETASDEMLERFAAIAAAAQREKVAHWMRSMGYATGHGDTIEDLLDHLGTQISEGTLRDYFAANALQGLLACPKGEGENEKYAQWSYEYADAMLAERSKT